MNQEIREFANNTILKKLSLCSEPEVLLFKRMYAKGKIEDSIEKVVQNMDEDRITRAIEQIDATLSKK